MARQEEIGLLLKLKDGVTKVFKGIKKAGNTFAGGMKTIMRTVSDSFKHSMLSAVALGTAISQFGMKAISSLQQWAAAAKQEFEDFEKGLTNVYTLLDEDTFNENAKDIEEGAIKIMQEYNLSIEDVNKSLFDSVSAGVEAGEATEFLSEAARLAKGGVTDLSVAVDGMTSVINAFGLETEDATRVADAFFTAQKHGKTTVEELANNIGKVAPIAKAAGLSFEELLAATSQMTLSGISTEEAVTALKGSLTAIIKPTDDAAGVFRSLGIPFGSAAFEGGKFGETMEMIKNQTEGNIDEIAKLIPNIRGLLAVTSVATDEGLVKYEEILEDVRTDTESLTLAMEKQMSTMKEQIDTEKGKLLPAKLKLGKLLSQLHLGWLKLANSVLKVKNIYVESMGVYGQIVNRLSQMADKIIEITGIKRKERDQEAEINEEKMVELEENAEREVIIEADKANKKAEINQDFIDNKVAMDKIAETARIAFEKQKLKFDALTSQQQIDLLIKTVGQTKVIRTAAQIDALKAAGKHEEAKKKQNEFYQEAFIKLNKDTLKEVDEGFKKHWSFILAGAKLNAKERKELDDVVGQSFKDLMFLMGEESEAAFRVMQGMAIVQTIIKTIEAAQAAYAALAGIPIVGPVLGGIAAGVAAAAGAKRVEEIRRQRPPQAETGGYVAKSGLAEIHKGEDIITKKQREDLAAGGTQIINLQLEDETVQTWTIKNDEEGERLERLGLR